MNNKNYVLMKIDANAFQIGDDIYRVEKSNNGWQIILNGKNYKKEVTRRKAIRKLENLVAYLNTKDL